ncbi:MAG TPA: hypothetical protein VMP68_23460, partial [Candidatus Eisenbacteria bacterium]|nr:hypothetical protein [Candidatus Eisenbacteria bacterium]
LRKPANGVFENLLGVTFAEKEENIYVGIRKEPAAPEAAGRDESEIGRLGLIGRDDVMPKTGQNFFNQARAVRDTGAAFSRGFEVSLYPSGLVVK